MKKPRDKSAHLEPIRKMIQEYKGKRFILDCGHKVKIGDGRSNTMILYSSGKAVCHNCGY